jgi:tetratricopeptide (TPR) repeat protein
MNVLLALVLVTASVAAPPAPATPPPGPGPVTSAASAKVEKLVLDGKADEAVTEGRAAVVATPDDIELRLAFARALAAKARRVNRRVNVAMSKDDVAKGQLTVPGVDLAAATLQVEYDTALFDEAIAQLEYGIKKFPRRLDLRVFQCFLLTDAGHIDRAKAAIVATFGEIQRSPALAKTFTSYGAERAKRGDYAGAAELLAPVVNAFQNDPVILVDYANVLTRLGKKTEAYAHFDRATELDPKDVKYARTKAVGAMLLRDYQRAQTSFDTTFRLGHAVADEFASYAAAYGIDPKASVALMRQLAAPSAAADPAVSELASSFARAGTSGASSKDAMALARSLLASQQFVLAIPVLDRACKANPKNAEAKAMLQTTFKSLGCEALAK